MKEEIALLGGVFSDWAQNGLERRRAAGDHSLVWLGLTPELCCAYAGHCWRVLDLAGER